MIDKIIDVFKYNGLEPQVDEYDKDKFYITGRLRSTGYKYDVNLNINTFKFEISDNNEFKFDTSEDLSLLINSLRRLYEITIEIEIIIKTNM